MNVRRARYESNIPRLRREVDAKLKRIVARAARDGARRVTAISDPPIDCFATPGETSGSRVSARVFVGRNQWWATIFDLGSLGQREVPLVQPGRQEKSWRIRRRGRTYTARRSEATLSSGGIAPQYFFIRGKRHAEKQLAAYVRNGL